MTIETGHHHIDEHHEELLNLDTMLDKAIASCRRVEVEPIIVFLEHYVKDHFKEEEDLMKAHDYKGLSLHQSEHRLFASFVKECRIMYDDNMPTTHIIFRIRKLLDQLVKHIKSVDVGIQGLGEHHGR